MSYITSVQASGSPAQQATTGKMRSKAMSVIGYFRRQSTKFKLNQKDKINNIKQIENVQQEIIIRPSTIGLQKLVTDVKDANPYSVLTDFCMNDRACLAIGDESFDQACRNNRITDITQPIVVKPAKAKRVKINCDESYCRSGCQTNDSVLNQTETQPEILEKQIETVPRRLIAKLAADKKSRFVYSKLLNYLRCKHFMHTRDHHFITTLVADARAWLLKGGHDMEKPLTFAVLANAVTQAFMVNQEELDFRARIKNPVALDHIEHLNATMSGELGRVSYFKGKGLVKTLASAARRPLTRAVRIPSRPGNLI